MAIASVKNEALYKFLNPEGDPFRYNPKTDKDLEIIGLVLWLSEGDRTQLSLANGNPNIIRKYLRFLREICNFKEEKIRAVIHCHDTLSYKSCIRYWSKVTKIPFSRFRKPFIKKDKGGKRNYPYGILRIVAQNVKLINIFNERLKEMDLSKD